MAYGQRERGRLGAVSISVLALLICFWSESGICAEPVARITVEAAEHVRIDTPVCVSLEGVEPGPLGFLLKEIDGSGQKMVVTQIEPGRPAKLWWILDGRTEAGDKRVYELLRGDAGTRDVKVVKDDKALEIEVDGHKVLRYNHAPVPLPKGVSDNYIRGAFIHPLWSPTGAVLTNIHPKDHYHHVGIWMPWTKTKFEDKEVDFWNLGAGQGTVRFVKFLSTTSGPVYGGFEAEHEHIALQTAEGAKVVLKEVWDVRVYNVGGPEKGYRLCDFKSTQRCVADSPLYQIQYRYGGFGYRGAAQWQGQSAAYLTSEGKTRRDGHATRARWCDTAGAIDGKWAGITHMSHPGNFRHPEPMRIWPEGQVFFNWAPSQAGDWVMEPGRDYVFRYRLYVHEGKPDATKSERFWCDFAEPPGVTLEKADAARQGPIVLFDGTDFSHWTGENDRPVKWKIVDGAMQIVPGTGSIMTKRDFNDFRLHIEFKTPEMPPNVTDQGRGNSGVYIQRRYEVQILDSYGLEPVNNGCGSLYGLRAPDKNVCKRPGQWQSYDITFYAARYDGQKKIDNVKITVVHNGVLIHDDVELENKTGAGRAEGPEPGAILLQDHGNEVCFRNIRIEPL